MYTIEVNLDDDISSSCAYHINDLDMTIKTNLTHAIEGTETNRWVLIGIAETLDKASDLKQKLHEKLCIIHGKEPKFLPLA
jgi:hypothetical protein